MTDDLVDFTGLERSVEDICAELDRVRATRDELLAALKRAVEVIRAFHSLGLTFKEEQQAWELYQQSPEMQAINAAIAKAEGIKA